MSFCNNTWSSYCQCVCVSSLFINCSQLILWKICFHLNYAFHWGWYLNYTAFIYAGTVLIIIIIIVIIYIILWLWWESCCASIVCYVFYMYFHICIYMLLCLYILAYTLLIYIYFIIYIFYTCRLLYMNMSASICLNVYVHRVFAWYW